jgi:hypothetical protein
VLLADPDAVEQAAVGDAGCREHDLARGHVGHVVFAVEIGDADAQGVIALFGGIEDQPALHLAPDAAQRRSSQHPLGRAAGTQIDIDARFFGVGGVNDAGDVAVADQLDRDARHPEVLNERGVAGPVEDAGGDFGRRHTLGPGEGAHIVDRRLVEIDEARRVPCPDRHLGHVDVGGVQQPAPLGDRQYRNRVRLILGAQRCAFERIDRDVDRRTVAAANALAEVEHAGLARVALADDDGAGDVEPAQFVVHGLDGGGVGGLLVALAAP